MRSDTVLLWIMEETFEGKGGGRGNIFHSDGGRDEIQISFL